MEGYQCLVEKSTLHFPLQPLGINVVSMPVPVPVPAYLSVSVFVSAQVYVFACLEESQGAVGWAAGIEITAESPFSS